MKCVLIFILLISICSGQQLFEGAAGDVWHLTGSCIGTLFIDKYTDYNWATSATIMFSLGFLWEIGDEYISTGYWDKKGFCEKDLLFDGIGCLLSYPLKYDNIQLNFSSNKVLLTLRL